MVSQLFPALISAPQQAKYLVHAAPVLSTREHAVKFPAFQVLTSVPWLVVLLSPMLGSREIGEEQFLSPQLLEPLLSLLLQMTQGLYTVRYCCQTTRTPARPESHELSMQISCGHLLSPKLFIKLQLRSVFWAHSK